MPSFDASFPVSATPLHTIPGNENGPPGKGEPLDVDFARRPRLECCRPGTDRDADRQSGAQAHAEPTADASEAREDQPGLGVPQRRRDAAGGRLSV